MKNYFQLLNKNIKGFIFALLGTILLSFNFISTKYLLNAFNIETFSVFWAVTGTFYSFMTVLILKQKKDLKQNKKGFFMMFLLGISTAVAMIFAWNGMNLLDPSFSVFLWRFAPIITILLGLVFLNEKLSFFEALCLLLMITGGLISSIGRWHIVGLGIIFTMAAALFTSFTMVLAKVKSKDTHPSVLGFYRVGIASILLILWAGLRSKINLDVPAHYWYILFIGAIAPVLSFLCIYLSFKYWELSHTSIIMIIQPVFVIPLAIIAFGKVPVFKELFGGLLIFAGAVMFLVIHFNQNNIGGIK